jgi:riboflavin transporter FmnP
MVLAIMLVALKLPSVSTTDETPNKGQRSKLRRIDFVGAFMLAIATVSFLLALSLGGHKLSWFHPFVIGLLIGSILLGIVFITYEVNYAFEPIFPPRLLVKRDVATPYAIILLQTAAQLAVSARLPFYLENTLTQPDDVLGASLLPRNSQRI